MKLIDFCHKNCILFVSILLAGCAINNHSIISATGTSIGVEITQNPATQMPNAKLGYVRSELAYVPITNNFVPDVLHELSYSSIFSLKNSAIYQRMAVGSVAVSQPGATALFSKSADGSLDPAVAAAIQSVPEVDVNWDKAKAPLARSYIAAENKSVYDEAAKAAGYPAFSDFLLDKAPTVEAFLKIRAKLGL